VDILFKSVLEISKSSRANAVAYGIRARSLQMQGKYKDAKENYLKAIENGGSSVPLSYGMGQMYLFSGQF